MNFRWRALSVLHGAMTGAALFVGFRGCFDHVVAMLLFLSVPIVGLLFVPAYRRELFSFLARCWGRCRAFAESGEQLPWRSAFVLVTLPAAILFMANKYVGTGDNLPVMLVASSLVAEGDWDVDEYFGRPGFECLGERHGPINGCVRKTPSGVYSNYPAGPVQFALPVVASARLVGANLDSAEVQDRLHKWTAAWLSAVCLGLFFLIALHVAEPAPAWVATLLLATGSTMYTTVGQGLWQHGGIVFWSLVALLVEFRRGRSPFRYGALLQGIACGMMLACRLSAVVVIIPFGVWLLVRSPRRAMLVTATACLAYLPWAVLYQFIYDHPLGPSDCQTNSACWSLEPLLAHLAGVLVSPGRGVLVYQPWAILALGALLGSPGPRGRFAGPQGPGLLVDPVSPVSSNCGGETWGRLGPPGWRTFCVAAIVMNLLLVSAWSMWWGGWCWGSRLMADTIPLWALLCMPAIARLWKRRSGRVLLVAFVLLGFLLHAPLVYFKAENWNGVPGNIDQQPERLWSWSRPPFLGYRRQAIAAVPESSSDFAPMPDDR